MEYKLFVPAIVVNKVTVRLVLDLGPETLFTQTILFYYYNKKIVLKQLQPVYRLFTDNLWSLDQTH